jgi:hypothetical protein
MINDRDLQSVEAICAVFRLDLKKKSEDHWIVSKPGQTGTVQFWANRRIRRLNGKTASMGYRNETLIAELQLLIDKQ